ncbi:MAG: hypothetical protein IJP02_04735 [Oscillospiraceae bacterium]|nr:hypothetical protein [Oscillospiraceae bacterium]
MANNIVTAGYAKLDITPPLGTYIGGYYNTRYTKGVLDPLYVRAIAFGEGEKSAVVISVELCSMRKAGMLWPPVLAERLGLPEEAVFVCCTHTHTSPEVFTEGRSDEQYDAWLLRRLGDVAQLALDDRRPVVDMLAGERHTEGLTYSRRYRMKDGAEMGNPPAKTWQDVFKIARPLGNIDSTMRLVRILREDAPEILMLNFQSHPDMIGKYAGGPDYISADWPGAACARLEEKVPGACAILLQGAQGNMVPTNRTKPLPPCGTKNYANSMAFGAQVADTALEMYEGAVSILDGGLNYAKKPVRLKTKRGTLPLDYCRDIVSRYKAGGLEAIDPSPKIATPIVAEAQQVLGLEEEELDYIDTPLTVLSFGGLALAGVPGEPFSEFGREVREQSKFPITCTCCLTNGSLGYFANRPAIEEGGYDTVNGKFVPGAFETLRDTAIEMLNGL